MVGAVRDWRCVQACCWAVGRLLGLTAHRYASGTHGRAAGCLAVVTLLVPATER